MFINKSRCVIVGLRGVLAGVFACLVLAGCSKTLMYVEILKPGSVTVEEVRNRHPPTREWIRPDGGATFEYAGDMEGEQSRRLDFGKDGRFVEWYRPATVERMEQVKRAMTRQEVLAILGEPNRRSTVSMTGGELWEWVLGVGGMYENSQRCIVVEWHPRVDGATKVYEDGYSL